MRKGFLAMTLGMAVMMMSDGVGAAEKPYVLKVVRKGETQTMDPTAFPKEMQDAYRIMVERCLHCHGQDRIIGALQTGKSRTGTPYGEKSFHEKIVHMLRQGGVGMSHEEAKKLTEFFTFLTEKVKNN